MPIDPQALYTQLGRLVEAMPELYALYPLPRSSQEWVGRVGALIAASGDVLDMPIRRFVTGINFFGARRPRGGVIPLIHRQFGVSYSIQIQESTQLKVGKAGRAHISRSPEAPGHPVRVCVQETPAVSPKT